MEIIRAITLLTLLCIADTADAQQSFVQRIKARHSGDGTVVLHQDATLDALVNGTTLPSASKRSKTTTDNNAATAPVRSEGNKKKDAEEAAAVDDPVVETAEVDLGDGRKVYRNSIKMQGFRVQVYSGGNSRKAKQAAERMARQVKGYFPDQPVYTHFYSPRWICRVGDFRTIEEANEMLRQMKEKGDFRQAVIVKSIVQIAL